MDWRTEQRSRAGVQHDKNQEEVTFLAAGEEWEPDVSAVIHFNSALACIREFCTTFEQPSCIQWQEL